VAGEGLVGSEAEGLGCDFELGDGGLVAGLVGEVSRGEKCAAEVVRGT
jgi:hypothetical protein